MGNRQEEVKRIKQENISQDFKKYGDAFFVLNKDRGKYVFSDEQKSFVIKTYYKPYEDATNIAKRFGVSYAFINGRLKQWSVKMKSASDLYRLHEDTYNNFFEDINSEEKAYWLGFIYADATITKNYIPPSRANSETAGITSFTLTLQESDELHLRDLASLIGLERDRVRLETYYTESVKRDYTYASLSLRSDKMVEDLMNLGMVPAHTLEEDSRKEFMEFPLDNLDNRIIRHFIRGYFEGDGSLTHAKRKGKYIDTKHYTVKFLGNERICRFLKEYFKHETINSNNNSVNVYKAKDKGFIYSYERGGNHNTYFHLCKMYEGASIFLERKKKQVTEFFEYFQERNKKMNQRPTNERKSIKII